MTKVMMLGSRGIISCISVSQTVIRGRAVVCGDLQAVSEEKILQKMYKILNEVKNVPILFCAKTAYVG
jgi:hypothetical protein